MIDQPEPMLQQMLQSLSKLEDAPPPAPVSTNDEPIALNQEVAAAMDEAAMFAQFRQDMRAAGLTVYNVMQETLGVQHEGPAVSVRDPRQATDATTLRLTSFALAPGLWRMYPVMEPLTA